MNVTHKYKSDVFVSGRDWHAGFCFYTLEFLEFEIFADNSCKLTSRIYLDKSLGGFNRDESTVWRGDLNGMRPSRHALLKPEKANVPELEIWIEKVPKNSDWIFMDINKEDHTGQFKYFRELVLKEEAKDMKDLEG